MSDRESRSRPVREGQSLGAPSFGCYPPIRDDSCGRWGREAAGGTLKVAVALRCSIMRTGSVWRRRHHPAMTLGLRSCARGR
jgi:hypothetical protein